jgi:hypothetical protein
MAGVRIIPTMNMASAEAVKVPMPLEFTEVGDAHAVGVWMDALGVVNTGVLAPGSR